MTIQTFIFVHNQKIVLDFIEHEKFKNSKNLKYVFLGDGEIDKIENLQNVIIARKFTDNIEDYPKLTSYTGWYLIWKNKLYNCDYINLFEYDVNISENIESILQSEVNNSRPEIFGYIPFNVHRNEFLKVERWCENLKSGINNHYGINVLEVISSLPLNKECSMTSNHTFSRNSFEMYMNWIQPLITDIKKSFYSGHEVERSISAFYLLNNVSYKIIEGALEHFQFDSHKTQGISESKFINNYNKLLT